MAYIEFDDIPLAHATPVVKRSQRRQQATFGDGYVQLLTDGLEYGPRDLAVSYLANALRGCVFH
jgi:hypothetical protein